MSGWGIPCSFVANFCIATKGGRTRIIQVSDYGGSMKKSNTIKF